MNGCVGREHLPQLTDPVNTIFYFSICCERILLVWQREDSLVQKRCQVFSGNGSLPKGFTEIMSICEEHGSESFGGLPLK